MWLCASWVVGAVYGLADRPRTDWYGTMARPALEIPETQPRSQPGPIRSG
ncbi:hypothetical protein DB30_02204 [Enhygromyxa salina]|uniref:Uncharacterized protein n=1 Tax=Enhygromyxa salina TaxID=215803 RepID=A0A0C1ZKE8_9BACT|nr:hypothetical protein DB30_02204 [Enhygromyxa salina]